MKKYLLSLGVGWLLLASAVWYHWPDQYVHLVVCDVGQGDALLIWQGFTQVLIDAGRPDAQVLECLNQHLPFWDRQLELAVATHADSDHIGGFPAVLDKYGVSYLLVEPIGKKTGDFLEFHESVSRKIERGSRLVLPQFGQTLTIGSHLTFITLSPQESSGAVSVQHEAITETQLWDAALTTTTAISSYNDRSVVLLARMGQIEVLLTGDLEYEGEQALLTQGLLGKITILKVGHHGSKTSTSDDFLRATQPEIALFSSGQNNKYGHPAPEVVEKLRQSGAKIMRTDEEGSVHLITDGETVWRKEEGSAMRQ